MEITLVVNSGSTSKKYALFDGTTRIFMMRFEETGSDFGVCWEKQDEQQLCENITATMYEDALSIFLSDAKKEELLKNISDIEKIGMRVVVPIEYAASHREINSTYLEKLEKAANIAPLHIPPMLKEIKSLRRLFPKVAIIGASDSAFHSTVPPYRKKYSIPLKDAEEYEIYRYGYHGLSAASISSRLESVFDEMPKRTIVCHIGSGVSVMALENGASADTSMTYTPASGVMMSSRGGDVDATALVTLIEKKGFSSKALRQYLSCECGLRGITGVSDMRLVLARYEKKEFEAVLAIDMFVHQIHKQIGAHIATLGGLDAVVLTATAVVRNPELRSLLLSGLQPLGIELDTEKNEELIGIEGFINKNDSKIKIAVMETDEMGEIAKVVSNLAGKL